MVTEQVWRGYLKTGTVPSGIVSTVVIDSWQRCKKAGLDATLRPLHQLLGDADLAERKVTKAPLIRACRPVIATLLKNCNLNSLLIVIADQDGYVLDINGDIKILNCVQSEDLLVGSNWQECLKGTNGIGTVLETRDTVELCGYDHYFRAFHNWHWCGAPVLDETGKVSGVVSVIKVGAEKDGSLSGLVALAAQSISLQLAENYRFSELQLHLELNHYLLELIPYGILMVDKSGTVKCINHALEKAFGVSAQHILGKCLWEIQHEEKGVLEFQSLVRRTLQTGQQFTNVHQTIKDHTGVNQNYQISTCMTKNQENQTTGAVGVLRDCSFIRHRNTELLCPGNRVSSLNVIDNLTKLYNHKFFHERLKECVALNQTNGKPLSLLIVDIDHFKHYNEVMGYEAGDKLLAEMGSILNNSIRGKDTIARYGGEEFGLILNNAEPDLAIKVAERIKNMVENYPFDGREMQPGGKISVSIGLASYPHNAQTKEELIKFAEQGLEKAQKERLDKISFYFTVFDELKNELNHLDLTLLNTIRTLITVINAKDKYTYGHSERVVLYSTALARSLGLNDEEIKFLRYGAYLHDIGKIEISREILNKKEPLTNTEWELLKNHPQWGAEIIKPVSALKQILPQILYHHERYDGRGYPEGLAGEQIPLPARILTIADCFDAMTTDRPYQQAISTEEALEQLKLHAGRIFDPALVFEFINIIHGIDISIYKINS